MLERDALANPANAAPADSTELHAHLLPLLNKTLREPRQLESFGSAAKLPLHKLKLQR